MPDELRQLPWILAKLLGGLLAAGGMLVAVLSATHAASMPQDLGLPAVACGLFGVVLFIGADRIMRPMARDPQSTSRRPSSLLPWVVLLLFAAAFLGAVLLLTA